MSCYHQATPYTGVPVDNVPPPSTTSSSPISVTQRRRDELVRASEDDVLLRRSLPRLSEGAQHHMRNSSVSTKPTPWGDLQYNTRMSHSILQTASESVNPTTQSLSLYQVSCPPDGSTPWTHYFLPASQASFDGETRDTRHFVHYGISTDCEVCGRREGTSGAGAGGGSRQNTAMWSMGMTTLTHDDDCADKGSMPGGGKPTVDFEG